MNPISSEEFVEKYLTASSNSVDVLEDGLDDNIFAEFSVLDGSSFSHTEKAINVC